MLMLIFYIENDCYCCLCDSIIEIIPKVFLKQIHQMPEYLAGILNYGGDSVPVIDLSMIIAKRPSKNKMHTRIILFKSYFEGNPKIIGVIAEKIFETRDINPSLFNEFKLNIKNLHFLSGVCNTESGCIQQINIEQLFSSLPEIFDNIND